jgi:hypothetical protein
MKFHTHLNLVPSLKISGAVPLLPIYAIKMQAIFPHLITYEGKNAATLQAILLNTVHCSNFVIYKWQCFRTQFNSHHQVTRMEEICTLFSPLVEGLSYRVAGVRVTVVKSPVEFVPTISTR